MTQTYHLICFFDAWANLNADVALFERTEPLAESVLRTWAGSRNLSVTHRLGADAIDVVLPNEYRITVYRIGAP